MSVVEKVSSFEYRVWRMKRWFFMNAVSVMLFAGLILSVWAVFSIDIPLISKIPCNFSDRTIEGWNRASLALAYSYIAGMIIYGMTVKYPYYLNKRRLAPVINAKVEKLGSMLAWMNIEFRDGGNNPLISDIDGIMALFRTKRWKERCRMPEHSGCKDVTNGYEKSKGNCDYTDDFYELILQPEYRRLILLYYSLCKVSGIKVKE